MPSADFESLPSKSHSTSEKIALESSMASVEPEDSTESEGTLPAATANDDAVESSTESAAGQADKLEDLTLSELVALFVGSPAKTWRRLQMAANADAPLPVGSAGAHKLSATYTFKVARPSLSPRAWSEKFVTIERLRLYLYTLAVLFAFLGSVYARGTPEIPRVGEYSLRFAAPYLWLGFFLWLAGGNLERLLRLKRAWPKWHPRERMRLAARIIPVLLALSALHQLAQAMGTPFDNAEDLLHSATLQLLGGLLIWISIELVFRIASARQRQIQTSAPGNFAPAIEQQWIVERRPLSRPLWLAASRLRKLVFVLAAISSLYVWLNTSGNHISRTTILVWLLSIALCCLVFAPPRWSPLDWASGQIDVWRRIRWARHLWVIICVAMVMLLGFVLRFADLETSPPQLIADHVENIRDVHSIRYDGYRPIVFTNYNSRDPVHFYLAAAYSYLTGTEVSQYGLSLVSGLEGLLTLPLLFWLALEVMDARPPRFRVVYALLATALLAVSMWHFSMSRHGFRVPLCPLFVTASLVFYLRALRRNRRTDYVMAGLLLGFGLLSYQAVQMLPLVYVAGVLISLLFLRHSLRCRLSQTLNLAILAFVALIVYLPQFHFIIENPQAGLLRQSQAILGTRQQDEQNQSFQRQFVLPLMHNLQKNLLRFHYYGSSNWAFGPPNQPVVDPLVACFLLLGGAAWLTLMKSRDPALFLVPLVFIFMLLVPSLSLSAPSETLHSLRASGAIPPVFLIAALPLATWLCQLHLTIPKPWGGLLALSIGLGALLYAYDFNANLYGGSFTRQYLLAGHPHREAGKILRGFAESDGNYGNAFVVYSSHWWDTRAVGVEGGKSTFFNDPWPESVPEYLKRASARTDDLRLDPERDLLFFYHRDNQVAANLLRLWFPAGRPLLHELELESKSFYTYRVPALGRRALNKFLEANT